MRSGAAAAADEPTLCFGSEGSCHRAQLHDGSGLSRQYVMWCRCGRFGGSLRRGGLQLLGVLGILLGVLLGSLRGRQLERRSRRRSASRSASLRAQEIMDQLESSLRAPSRALVERWPKIASASCVCQVPPRPRCSMRPGGPLSEGQKNRDLVKKTPGAGPPQRPRS